MKQIILQGIRFYQTNISPYHPPSCRFLPTCSAYAYEAISKYGICKGGWLAFCRFSRCHPFHKESYMKYDPVP